MDQVARPLGDRFRRGSGGVRERGFPPSVSVIYGVAKSIPKHQKLGNPNPSQMSTRTIPADPQTDPQTDPQMDPQADPQTDPQTNPQMDPQTDPRRDPQTDLTPCQIPVHLFRYLQIPPDAIRCP